MFFDFENVWVRWEQKLHRESIDRFMSSQSSPDDESIGPTWVVTGADCLETVGVRCKHATNSAHYPNKQDLANSQFEIM